MEAVIPFPRIYAEDATPPARSSANYDNEQQKAEMEDRHTDLVIFQEAGHPVQVRLDAQGDTVRLSQRQMADVFETTPENVLMHLKNIFRDEELDEPATTKEFLAVQIEGKRQVRRNIRHYNLDAIISVGYRVSSKRAVLFHQWATRTLREHDLDGQASLSSQRRSAWRLPRSGIWHHAEVDL